MGAMSRYLEEVIINAILRNTSFTPPASIYLALYTDDPTDDDIGTELAGGGYERKIISFKEPVREGNATVVYNDNEIDFGIAESGWGTITHIGLHDSHTGGNLLYYGEIENPREVLKDDQLKIAENGIRVSIS